MAPPTVPSFSALLAQPGVVEQSTLASTFGFMAFHGGALEQRTDVIARMAAEASGASLYSVELPGPEPEHFPSTSVRREESPALDEFFDHVEVVVTVHGYGRWGRFTSLLLGGSNRELAARLAADCGRHCRTMTSWSISVRSRVSCAGCIPTTR